MDDDIISYFDKLLALKKAVQTGQPENIESMKSRLTILTPDAASRIRVSLPQLPRFKKYFFEL